MIPTHSLATALKPLLLSRWLGLSPRIGNSSPALLVSVVLSVSIILFLAASRKTASHLQIYSSAAALLYWIVRNSFDRSGFQKLHRTFQELEDLSGRVSYGFRWSFVVSVLQAASKFCVCCLRGLEISDIILVLYVLKQEEVLTLIHVLRCQSKMMKEGDLQRYRLVSRGLFDLQRYLIAELPVSSFLCILWSIETTFLGLLSVVIMLLQSNSSTVLMAECLSYWMSFLFTMGSLVAMVAGYKDVEGQKEEFEEQLYWSLISSPQKRNIINVKHVMLFQVTSRQEEEGNFQIDYKLIYSVISSTLTFLVIILQFESGNIICNQR